ncbi:response regulator [Actinomadura scrupuli]|uniref:response regulator n=1 Tax=Actinomadura scrupuli TaxID=559629 RepID=UPI003D9621B0
MPVSGGQLRLVLADDHTMVREGLNEVLSLESDLKIVGEAGTGVEAIALVKQLRPDVVILDVEMPQHDVITTLRQIRLSSPRTKVIVLTMHDDHNLVRDLLARGAHAFLIKSVSRHELVSAVRSVVQDEQRVVVSVSRESLDRMSDPSSNPLSEREREVLTLVARALSNAQIASRLSITEGTVKRHLRNVYTKLSAVSRLDAVNKSVAAGYIRLPKTK